MDNDKYHTHYSCRSTELPPAVAPAPLRIIKQSAQAQSMQGEGYPVYQPPAPPVYPPRSSSIKRRDNTDRHEVIQANQETQDCMKSEVASIHSADSLSSGYSGRSPYAEYFNSRGVKTAQSGPTSLSARCISESSTEILGDFVAVDTNKKMINPFTGKERTRTPYKAAYPLGQAKVIPNPYEFEPGSPYDNLARQTTFTDFIDSQNDTISSPRQAHVKNARSVGNEKPIARPNSLEVPLPTPNGRGLHRSESSPSVVPGRFPEHRRRSPSPSSPNTIDSYYYGAYDEVALPATTQRGRQLNNNTSHHERHHRGTNSQSPSRMSIRGHNNEMRSREPDTMSQRGHLDVGLQSQSPTRKLVRAPVNELESRSSRGRQPGYDSGSHSGWYQQIPSVTYNRSPTHSQRQGRAKEVDAKSSKVTHQQTSSSAEHHNNTTEHMEEAENEYHSHIVEPKRRSRSPMKKMFGQGGWLGNSPDGVNDFKEPPKKGANEKKASSEKKQDTAAKTSVMGKIRSKLEEFAEKADISPNRTSRSKSDKHPKIAVLSVSIGPPEQARIYMELELMLVHTANSFLMTQFRQGRIAIDSIKKTFDTWKSKGRPSVVEFMYDQATQRDLIAVNQHNFRFHGERAGDGIRVNSMLYNWKVVASHMAIRTFCNADTVILKLLFDLEQILELLGGAQGILLRLQNIRLSVNEKVHLAKKKRETEFTETFTNGRQVSWDNRYPSEDFSRREASGDPYGGLKLVPDFYAEKS